MKLSVELADQEFYRFETDLLPYFLGETIAGRLLGSTKLFSIKTFLAGSLKRGESVEFSCFDQQSGLGSLSSAFRELSAVWLVGSELC